MDGSPKWKVNPEDLQRWGKNALLFISPVAVIYFAFVGNNLQDGLNWNDFIPNATVQGAIILYLINTGLDFFRKLATGPK